MLGEVWKIRCYEGKGREGKWEGKDGEKKGKGLKGGSGKGEGVRELDGKGKMIGS